MNIDLSEEDVALLIEGLDVQYECTKGAIKDMEHDDEDSSGLCKTLCHIEGLTKKLSGLQ